MDKQHESQPTPPAARRLSAVSALAVAAALSAALPLAALAQPQSDRPKIAEEVEKKDEAAKPAEPASKPASTKRPKNGPRQSAPPPVEVTFKTDLPATEIFLRRGAQTMQSLGKTDGEGRLVVRLPRGRHDIVASRPGARILRQQIDVKTDSSDFAFNISAPAPPEKKDETGEVAAVAEPTPEDQAGNGAAGSADEVVRRFLYEKEGETVADGDWQRVQTETIAALEREPDNKQLRAQSLLAEGQVAFLRGDHASALVSLNKSVIAEPEYVAAHYALGNAYLATNQPAEAFKAYQRAATLNKDLAVAFRGMGDALTKQGKSRDAAQYYSRAKSFGQPLPTNTGFTAARDLKKRKRWAEAVRQFEEVARAEPSAEVFIDIGDCYVGLEQPLSASKAYLKATELDPKNALAHFRYGEVMFKLREWAAAMESLERALALDTTGATFNRKQARERANESAKKLGLRKDN